MVSMYDFTLQSNSPRLFRFVLADRHTDSITEKEYVEFLWQFQKAIPGGAGRMVARAVRKVQAASLLTSGSNGDRNNRFNREKSRRILREPSLQFGQGRKTSAENHTPAHYLLRGRGLQGVIRMKKPWRQRETTCVRCAECCMNAV